jgi:hypothetical protein
MAMDSNLNVMLPCHVDNLYYGDFIIIIIFSTWGYQIQQPSEPPLGVYARIKENYC